MATGELFEDALDTWTPAQAKLFFREGVVDDFFISDIGTGWVVSFVVSASGRVGVNRFVQLRAAREPNKKLPRKFTTADAAISAVRAVGFDTRSIGPSRPMTRAGRSNRSSPVSGDRV